MQLEIAIIVNLHSITTSRDTINLMWEVFLKRSRMLHLLDIDYYVESRVFLWYLWIWRLKVEKMSALCQFLSRATTESEERLNTFNKINVGNIWKIIVPQV